MAAKDALSIIGEIQFAAGRRRGVHCECDLLPRHEVRYFLHLRLGRIYGQTRAQRKAIQKLRGLHALRSIFLWFDPHRWDDLRA